MRRTLGLALLALLGWGAAYWGWKRPLPPPQIITEYKDRVETKTIYRETTKPDGTVIKETTQSKSDQKTHKAAGTAKAHLSRWSLGVSTTLAPKDLIDPNPIYGVQVGRRLLESPIWMEAGLNSRRELTLGLSIQF